MYGFSAETLALTHPRCKNCHDELKTIAFAPHDVETYTRTCGYLLTAPNGLRTKRVTLEEAQTLESVFHDRALATSLYERLDSMPGIREVLIKEGPYGGTFKVEIMTRELRREREVSAECATCEAMRHCTARDAARWGKVEARVSVWKNQ